MKQIYATIVFLILSFYSYASNTTYFSVDNAIQDIDKTAYLHSLEIAENATIVKIKIIPKKDFSRLNFWSSENTVIKVGELELPILGFQIKKNENGERIFSTEPFNGKWGWNDLKRGKDYYYTMVFEGKIPAGVFKISLIDKGTEDGYHGYIFRNKIINNEPLREYDFNTNPLKSTYFSDGEKIQSSSKQYSASLYSIKIFSNYTTATIKLVPNKDLESLRLYQSENTNLEVGIYTLPIQGFLGKFKESNDSILNSLPFDGSWHWSNVKAGEDYYYTMVFDGKIPNGKEIISIIDRGNDAGMRGFSFDDITISNPIPFEWSNFDDYVIYQWNHLIKYILSQNTALRIIYISILAIICLALFYAVIRLLTILLAKILSRIQNQAQLHKKSKKRNINDALKAKDSTIYINVLHTSEDTTEYKPQKLIKKTRFFKGRYLQYFSTGEYFSRVYLHPGDYLYKVVLSFIEIKERCKSSSIKKAFSECPSLLQQLEGFIKGENSDWVYVKWTDGQESICLRNMFVFNEVGAYWRGYNSLKWIIAEVPKIQTSLLKEKISFTEFLRKNFKWIIRGGVKLLAATVAGYIGANLPDFDFDVDVDVPDIDPDFDFDIDIPDVDPDFDIDSDFDNTDGTDLTNSDNPQNGYNVSFGAQKATLNRSGGGLGSIDVTITKEPGSANLFCITDGSTTIHNVPGTDNIIKFNGIKYKLPTLKG